MSNLMLYHTKKSNIEFSVDVSGVNDNDMSVRFVIETAEMDLSFSCKKTDKNNWACEILPLKFLEKTTYNYRIEVYADGYYLKGSVGTVSISATAEIYTTEPKNINLTPIKQSEPEQSKKKDTVKQQKSNKPETKEENKTKEVETIKEDKDTTSEAIAAKILNDMTITCEKNEVSLNQNIDVNTNTTYVSETEQKVKQILSSVVSDRRKRLDAFVSKEGLVKR